MNRNRESYIREALEQLSGDRNSNRTEASPQLPPRLPPRNPLRVQSSRLDRGRDSHVRQTYERLAGDGEEPSRSREQSRDDHRRAAYALLTGEDYLLRWEERIGEDPEARSRDSHILGAFEQLTSGEQLSRAEAEHQVRRDPTRQNMGSRRTDRLPARSSTRGNSTYETANTHGPPPRRSEEHLIYFDTRRTTSNHPNRDDQGRRIRQAGPAYECPSGQSGYQQHQNERQHSETRYSPQRFPAEESTRYQQQPTQRNPPDNGYSPQRFPSTSSRYPQSTPTADRGEHRTQRSTHTNHNIEPQSGYINRSASVSHHTNRVPRDRQYEPRSQTGPVRSNPHRTPINRASRDRQYELQPPAGLNRTNSNRSPDRYFTLRETSPEQMDRRTTPPRPQIEAQRPVSGQRNTTVTRDAGGRLQLERSNSKRAPSASRGAKLIDGVAKYVVGDY